MTVRTILTLVHKPQSRLYAARLASAGVTFLTQILLARLVPSSSLGLYFMATSTVMVLAILSCTGYPNIANRMLARYRASGSRTRANVFALSSSIDILLLSLLTAMVGICAVIFIVPPEQLQTMAIALIAIPFIALSIFWGAVLNARSQFMWASLPEFLLRPFGLLFVIAICAWFAIVPSAELLILTFLVLYIVIALLQLLQVKLRAASGEIKTKTLRLKRCWRGQASPLMILTLFTNLFADVVIVCAGFYLGHGTLALFVIALKVAFLIGFFIQISHQVALPKLADAFHEQDLDKLHSILARCNLLASGSAGAALIAIVLFGDLVLSIFGEEYSSALDALKLLVTAQFLRALIGPSAQLLVIAGRQRIVFRTTIFATFVLIASMAVLASAYGATGAAISVLLSYTLWHLMNAVMLYRDQSIFSFFLQLGFMAQSVPDPVHK